MVSQQELQEQLTDLKAEIVDLSQSIASLASKNASEALLGGSIPNQGESNARRPRLSRPPKFQQWHNILIVRCA